VSIFLRPRISTCRVSKESNAANRASCGETTLRLESPASGGATAACLAVSVLRRFVNY
jgi:hypothetical protein